MRSRWYVPGKSGLTRAENAALWRAAARGFKTSGDMVRYRQAARTAAIIEGRPWKTDLIG